MKRRKKVCFVIIGYGIKTDYTTGRNLNLDNTYTGLIKPVFDDLGIECFRAKDIPHSGVIDKPMYEWIYKADFVVADISTLNPNVLYELGVRHALKPYTTIIIAEDMLDKVPFDLNHLLIDPLYHHLGEDIGVQEAKKFTKELKKKVSQIIKNPQNDSPVYNQLKGLDVPRFTEEEINIIKEKNENIESLSELIIRAENAKRNSDFQTAIKLFKKAIEIKPKDVFLTQRFALVKYKSEKPNKHEALIKALKIISTLSPKSSTDPETLGLCGAIYKRLFEVTGNMAYLDKAIFYYEKGFYIKQDYYNAINLAYLYTLQSTLQKKRDEALTDYFFANRIRKRAIEICEDLVKSRDFKDRSDKNWIYFTLAESYIGLGKQKIAKQMIKKAEEYSEGTFDMESFSKQKSSLEGLINYFKQRQWK